MTTWDEPYAWEYLAQCFDGARYWWWALIEGERAWGLCEAIDVLFRKSADKTLRCMRARMAGHVPRGVEPGGYWWPLTKAGARARAEFCRRMAREARKEARDD